MNYISRQGKIVLTNYKTNMFTVKLLFPNEQNKPIMETILKIQNKKN